MRNPAFVKSTEWIKANRFWTVIVERGSQLAPLRYELEPKPHAFQRANAQALLHDCLFEADEKTRTLTVRAGDFYTPEDYR